MIDAPTASEPAVLLRLVGRGPLPGRPVVLAHGEDPADAVRALGLRVVRLREAVLSGEHELTLTLEVVPSPGGPAPAARRTRRDPDVREEEIPTATRRRRIAAYALVRHDDSVLLTVLSDKARAAPGSWTMPGGGVDEGEDPADAVVREVWEETGQRVRVDRLLGVTSDHWVGRAPDGTLEDFQPIRLLYAASCPEPSELVVHDVGGTTASAAWVPVDEVHDPAFPIVRSWATTLRARLRRS